MDVDDLKQPFAFAVQAAPSRHAVTWCDLASTVEGLGYRALLSPDHVGRGGPLVAAAAAGASTERLHVGPLVLAIGLRPAVVLAEELLTLSAVLPGRVELGLGAGWMQRDFQRTGTPMGEAVDRIALLREAVERLQLLFSDEGEPAEGSPWAWLTEALERPLPPRPAFVLGGGGPRMLELAAELGDIVNVGASMAAGSMSAPIGPSGALPAFHRRTRLILDVAARHRRAPLVQCLAYETAITSAGAQHAHGLAGPWGLDAEGVLASPLALVGTVDEVCSKIQRLRDALGISYWVVKSNAVHHFAPVLERLNGR